jgi:mRNA interferase HigB
MHVITYSALKNFYEIHPESETGLRYWYRQAKIAKWKSFPEVRDIFPSADLVNNFIVFNICGNKYRLITLIDFQAGIIFIRKVLTHADYDKNQWKQDQWYRN